MIDVSVIIVSYNTLQLTKNCLNSIFEQTTGLNIEVIVSDNGSSDGSVEMIKSNFPSVILIENNQNLGFGKANNQGLKIAKGKYIFYLNSDTVLLNNAIYFFYNYWEHSNMPDEIGAIGGILVDEKLRKIHSGGKFPTYETIYNESLYLLNKHRIAAFIKFFHLSWILKFRRNKIDRLSTFESNVDYVTGADLFLKNDNNAYFDENYFLYYEETDLELALVKKGKKCFLIDGPEIMHCIHKQPVGGYKVSSFSTVQCQISELRYVKKNLNHDLTDLYKIIKRDWRNPYISKMVKSSQKILDLIYRS